ncbi:MAG TPA: metallopeptidase family protein [Candidatus Saccharimonadales bacterium]|nr:metallopeptidase family protein [Candidatus Saccharimonadales bacterium]
MIDISDEQFQELINEALAGMPKERMEYVKNVAFLFEDEPTPEQREKLFLRGDQTLLGLYEGVPLTQRQGMPSQLPDKITLFKLPLCMMANDLAELKEEIRHTMWHELAHYFGLNHTQIHERE